VKNEGFHGNENAGACKGTGVFLNLRILMKASNGILL